MNCPKCGYDNRESARFCHRCGGPLQPEGSEQEATKPLPREGAKSNPLPDTGPLPELSADFAALPVGALLRNGRYAVVEVRTANQRKNIYTVEDVVPVRLCPNCRAETTDPEEQFCVSCGADLSSSEGLNLRYIAQESADEKAFAVEAQLLRLRLDHPAVLLPRDAFTEAPYGPPRGYLVENEFLPPLATSLSLPQELHKVLKWGVALAQGLVYLHRHQVVLSDVGLGNVAMDEKRAYWRQLGSVASVIPPEQRTSAASLFSRNVSGLANLLFYLAVGQPDKADLRTLPDPVQSLFSRALSSDGFADAATFEAALESALQQLRRPSSVNLMVGRRTDVGQVRSLNEDSLLTMETSAVMRSVSVPVGLYVVADGMGGHDAGDVASGITVRIVAQHMTQEIQTPATAGESLPEFGPWLKATAQAANQEVYDQGRAAGSDMGTTLVMALFVGDRAVIANVGDSRAYLLTEEGTEQITVDHSLVERLVATGQITREEAAVHPQRNVIYRVIGDKPTVDADIFEKRLAPGQALLLCSDGLSGMVPDDELWTFWRTSTSPQEACDRMVEAANKAGGEDNITVIIVQVTE